ncbi:scavenger receptor cysteine-rich domain-containing protein SCART1-like, partial [Ciconia maguari]
FVRLVEGNSHCSGHVEIHDEDQWKTVYDSHFGPKSADVVCRELQCGVVRLVAGASHFGEGVVPIWDGELQCVGNESLLNSCPRGSPRDQPCTHMNSPAVTCTQYTGFTLVNGSTVCAGRVEVQVLGTGGTLCSSRWDLSDAHVLCRQLSCSAGFASLRLVGGGSRCDRRVEILQGGTWDRVLDDQWDVQEANMVCQQLQCGQAEAAYNPPKPERGMGPVALRGVRCAGHETKLTLCNTSLPKSSLAAGVAEDVGVICWGSRRVRLVNGAGRCTGRVEIYYQGSWGTVCDDGWDLSDASLVCHQLGCGGEVQASSSARFGEGCGQIWLDGMTCSGDEAALWDCPARPWGQHDCGHKEDAGVICSGLCLLSQCHGRSLPSPDREKIRPVGGEDGCSGRVEVWHLGSWGTVCDDSWDMRDAEVACRQLGCGPAVSALNEAAFGMGQGPICLEQVECCRTEPSLQDCWARPGDGGPTWGRLTSSGRVSIPVIICIILGALLCFLLALLAGQLLRARSGHRGSRRAQELFPEAVYEESGYSPVWEKQAKFGRSGDPLKLQPYPGDTEEEDGLGSAPDVLVLPKGDPADGYDDAREVSDPGEDAASGHGAWEMPRVPEEGEGPRDALRGPARATLVPQCRGPARAAMSG